MKAAKAEMASSWMGSIHHWSALASQGSNPLGLEAAMMGIGHSMATIIEGGSIDSQRMASVPRMQEDPRGLEAHRLAAAIGWRGSLSSLEMSASLDGSETFERAWPEDLSAADAKLDRLFAHWRAALARWSAPCGSSMDAQSRCEAFALAAASALDGRCVGCDGFELRPAPTREDRIFGAKLPAELPSMEQCARMWRIRWLKHWDASSPRSVWLAGMMGSQALADDLAASCPEVGAPVDGKGRL